MIQLISASELPVDAISKKVSVVSLTTDNVLCVCFSDVCAVRCSSSNSAYFLHNADSFSSVDSMLWRDFITCSVIITNIYSCIHGHTQGQVSESPSTKAKAKAKDFSSWLRPKPKTFMLSPHLQWHPCPSASTPINIMPTVWYSSIYKQQFYTLKPSTEDKAKDFSFTVDSRPRPSNFMLSSRTRQGQSHGLTSLILTQC